jgi:hypothetical protein
MPAFWSAIVVAQSFDLLAELLGMSLPSVLNAPVASGIEAIG